jgi:hypothetical protein
MTQLDHFSHIADYGFGTCYGKANADGIYHLVTPRVVFAICASDTIHIGFQSQCIAHDGVNAYDIVVLCFHAMVQGHDNALDTVDAGCDTSQYEFQREENKVATANGGSYGKADFGH